MHSKTLGNQKIEAKLACKALNIITSLGMPIRARKAAANLRREKTGTSAFFIVILQGGKKKGVMEQKRSVLGSPHNVPIKLLIRKL